MGRMFQIHEDDLVDLERLLPKFQDDANSTPSPELRTRFRRVKEIVSNVRWNYGPYSEVHIVPCGEQPEAGGESNEN